MFMIWRQGWIGLVLRSDASYLTWVMSALFIVFWLVSSYRVFIINKESNQFAMGNSEGIAAQYFEKLRIKSRNQNGNAIDQGMLASTLRGELVMSIHVIQYISNTLILLGLICTVVGFVIAFSGLGVTLGQGDDMEQVKGALGQIIDGLCDLFGKGGYLAALEIVMDGPIRVHPDAEQDQGDWQTARFNIEWGALT